jgi:phosphogluconate dehydratase
MFCQPKQTQQKWYAMTDSRLIDITNRIIERSRDSRAAYLAKVEGSRRTGPSRHHLGCANLAHGFAACSTSDKEALAEGQAPNLGVVSAYNEMLSAHVPYGEYLEPIKTAANGRLCTSHVRWRDPRFCRHGFIAV